MNDPDYEPRRLKAWKEFQTALAEANKKLAVLASVTPGGVHERCSAGLAQANLWSR